MGHQEASSGDCERLILMALKGYQVLLLAVVAGALTAFANQMVQKQAAPAGSDKSRDADRAAIEKLKQDDVVATVARDAVAMADLWTEDAVRFGPDTPAHIGRQAIREANERSTAGAHWHAAQRRSRCDQSRRRLPIGAPGVLRGGSLITEPRTGAARYIFVIGDPRWP